MTDAEATSLLKKIKKAYWFIKKTNDGADDCGQWVMMKILEGKFRHATFTQMAIDYLRTEDGKANSAKYNARHFELKD